MDVKLFYKIAVLLFVLLRSYECAKILALFPLQVGSHFNMFGSVLKVLAERGHNVDVLSHFPLKKPVERYNDMSVHGTLPAVLNNMTLEVLSNLNIANLYQTINTFANPFGIELCSKLFETKVVQDLYHNVDKVGYDLIITEVLTTDCFMVFAHKLKNVPVVGMSSCIAVPWITDRFGLLDNPAFTLNYFLNMTPPYSFSQRLHNTIVTFIFKWSYYYLQTIHSDEILRKILQDPNLPSMYEMEKRFDLLLINTHYSYYGAHPMPPNVKEVGGLHIKFESLPTHLELILNNSKNGVILFSTGSLVKMEAVFTPEKQRSLLEAFGELPYDIIWKVNKSTLVGLFPNNIHFEPWIYQREILCHPNTILFITHGGLFGTQEAIYCGVPMISIPFALDQDVNMKVGTKLGITIGLRHEHITKEGILNAINTVLNDSSYRKNIEHVSKIFRDRPMTPMDTAVYWIEYVIRHKGAKHLRPASIEMSWYQIYLLDVIFILILAVVSILITIYLAILSIYKKWKQTTKLKTA